MSSQEERIHLITMKRNSQNHDCHWLYDNYIKTILRKDEGLKTIKQDDKVECYFFIKKEIQQPHK